MKRWNVEYWLTPEEINEVEYAEYWNNPEKEKDKEWNILDGNFAKMEKYLAESGLLFDLLHCINFLKKHFNYELKGFGMDLAAGNLWAVPHLLRWGNPTKLYCLEYSQHRLLTIGPKVLEKYRVPREKVVLVLGSFYDLKLAEGSLDFVLLSAAFHHAARPEELLREIYRVLKTGGVVIMIGEHFINLYKTYAKYYLKLLASILLPPRIKQRLTITPRQAFKIFPRPGEILAPDPVLGDHHYTSTQYQKLFSLFPFQAIKCRHQESHLQSFVLIKQ
jgi:SAM-dependent methyltransferase